MGKDSHLFSTVSLLHGTDRSSQHCKSYTLSLTVSLIA